MHVGNKAVAQKLKRIGIIVGILVISLVIASKMASMKPKPTLKPKDETHPLVQAIDLQVQTVDFEVASRGTVRPLTQTALSAEVSGTIVSMSDKFLPGGSFSAGSVLMRIDPTNYDVALKRAEATMRQRQIEYDGTLKLKQQGYRAEAELASSEAALAAARADVVGAMRNLERSVVRLPFDGVVKDKQVELGEFVSPGSPLGVVFATDTAEVRLPLPDGELAFVNLPRVGTGSTKKNGAKVLLTGSYHGQQQTWPAYIVRTEGVVDESTRMIYAVARIDDPYLNKAGSESRVPLPIGTFVTAKVQGISVANLVRIPRSAVRANNQVNFIDAENQLRIRSVSVLRADAEFAYVNADGLTVMRVCLTALDAPLNGMQVRTNLDATDDKKEEPAATASADVGV